MIPADPQTLLAALGERREDAKRFVVAFTRGTVAVEMYAPHQTDRQSPHDQDELYVVYRGEGEFVVAGERTSFRAGSVFFVPSGVSHRFENFSDDFATWVVFCGPKGGELPEGDA